MVNLIRCNSCGGTYPDTRDGKTPAYFHACPEHIVDTPEVTDAKGNITTPTKFKPTPNPRNENLRPHPENPREFVIVSEGTGITEIP